MVVRAVNAGLMYFFTTTAEFPGFSREKDPPELFRVLRLLFPPCCAVLSGEHWPPLDPGLPGSQLYLLSGWGSGHHSRFSYTLQLASPLRAMDTVSSSNCPHLSPFSQGSLAFSLSLIYWEPLVLILISCCFI